MIMIQNRNVLVDIERLTLLLANRMAAIVPDGFRIQAEDGVLWYTADAGRFPGQAGNYLSSRGRGTAGLCLGAASLHSGTYAASGPEPGTWKDPDPRRRSSRGIRGLIICLAARHWLGNVTPAGCPVSTTSWRYGLRRTCRFVTGRSYRPRSTWSNQARLALLAVTHRYKRAHCLWLEQFQIADFVLRVDGQYAAAERHRAVSSGVL
jgi:hypothetical protein